MVSKSFSTPPYLRPYAATLSRRLGESRRFLQVVAGPRQVGKTTLVQHVLGSLECPTVYASADEPALRSRVWIAQQWDAARLSLRELSQSRVVLALDEIQKIPGWSETVKRLWDEDTASGVELHVVLLGSAPLPLGRGLTESLAGRFEIVYLPHWSYAEMRDAFGWDVDTYVFFGGYPGAAPLTSEPVRWARYIKDSLVETTISRDVQLLTRVDRPALLRRLFELACSYSGQVLSYQKMVGQLQDVGNTTTLAHYLDLLSGAGMVTGLQKWTGDRARLRGSSPKLQVLNNALMTAHMGLTKHDARTDRELWGRLVESAVGAHLANAALAGECELYYWRDRNREVDFVVRSGRDLTAIEVKSGRRPRALPGVEVFTTAFQPSRVLLVGSGGIAVDEFLAEPVAHWVGS